MLYNSKAIISLSLAIVLSACSGPPKKEKETSVSPVSVTLAMPSVSTQQGISVSGRIEADETANISTRIMGYITKINVKVGDYVKKGELLATINNDDMMAKKAQAEALLNQARAALTNAEKDFYRFTELHKQQSASDKELENITLQYSSAKAQVEAARQIGNEVNAMLTYTNLTAPFSGVVTQKMMDTGSIASPGIPILTIEQTSGLRASASVSEREIDKVKKGSVVSINIKSTDKKLSGKITEISQSSQFTGGQYLIKIDLSDNHTEGLYAGMYVNVFIPIKTEVSADNQKGSPLVPMSSIINRDQLTGLYTVSNNQTALLRWVRLGKIYGNEVEVLSGLDKNEKFIVSAEGKLYNGATVKEVAN